MRSTLTACLYLIPGNHNYEYIQRPLTYLDSSAGNTSPCLRTRHRTDPDQHADEALSWPTITPRLIVTECLSLQTRADTHIGLHARCHVLSYYSVCFLCASISVTSSCSKFHENILGQGFSNSAILRPRKMKNKLAWSVIPSRGHVWAMFTGVSYLDKKCNTYF
jgi:hypothetical protein